MVIRVEEPPAYLLKQLEALLSLPIASPPSRVEVEEQAVEVADRDDHLQGDDDGDDGDVGVVGLGKRHPLQAYFNHCHNHRDQQFPSSLPENLTSDSDPQEDKVERTPISSAE